MKVLPFLISGLGIGAVYALSGVGLVVLFRATGVLNFALGAIGAFGAHVAWSLVEIGWSLALACLAGILAATVLSFGYGRLIAPMLAYRDIVVRAIGTLGFAMLLMGAMGLIWGEVPRRLVFPTDKLFLEIFGTRLTHTRLIALILAALTVIGIGLLLAKTRLGLKMRALACDRDLSALLGVKILAVESKAWLLAGVFAGIAGLLLGNLVRLQGQLLTFLIVPAIAAAILGRLRSLPGTAIGGLFIGIVEAVLSIFPDLSAYRTAAPFAVALLAVTIFGRAADYAADR